MDRRERLFVLRLIQFALPAGMAFAVSGGLLSMAASKNVDLNADGTNESVVASSIVNATPPIKVQNKVTNKAVGQAFNFTWPSAGPGGFSSKVAAGTSTGVGAIWTWETVQSVYAFTGSTCTNDICFTRTTPADSLKRGAFGAPGYTLTSGSVTTTTASLTSSLIQFFSPPSEKFRFTSSVDQVAPGVYRYATTINNSTPSVVTLDVAPGPFGCGAVCGNGVLEGTEACDGASLGGRTCQDLGFPGGGSLGCTTSCELNTADCVQVCGNGVREGSEACDGADLNGQTCGSLGGGGNLSCLGDCSGFDLHSCAGLCGNGVADGADECDGADLGGNTCVEAGAIPVFDYSFFDGDNVCAVGMGSAPCGINPVGTTNPVSDELGRKVMRLTEAQGSQAGAAWTVATHPVVAGFTTTFRFRLGPVAKSTPADGIALVVQSAGPFALGSGGGFIGYQGIPNSVAVEFDTYYNGDFGDPNANHVAVHSCGAAPNTASHLDGCLLGSANPAPYLADGQVHTARVTYVPAAGCPSCDGTLSVYLDGAFLLGVPFDMTSTIGESGEAWVGMTGATGGAFETQDILSWSLGSPLPDPVPVDGNPACNSDCTLNASTCYNICGNGTRELDEACDGQDLAGHGCADVGLFGTVSCTPSCGVDYSRCTANFCGNGVIDTPYEECDGPDLGAHASCADFGSSPDFQPGCTPGCRYDLAACPGICGNGTVETAVGELCDGASLNGHTCEDTALPLGTRHGVLACKPGCGAFDTSGCLPVPPPACELPPTTLPTVAPHTTLEQCEIKFHPPKEITNRISVCGSNILDPAGTCTDFLTEGTAEILTPDNDVTIGPIYFAPTGIQLTDSGQPACQHGPARGHGPRLHSHDQRGLRAGNRREGPTLLPSRRSELRRDPRPDHRRGPGRRLSGRRMLRRIPGRRPGLQRPPRAARSLHEPHAVQAVDPARLSRRRDPHARAERELLRAAGLRLHRAGGDLGPPRSRRHEPELHGNDRERPGMQRRQPLHGERNVQLGRSLRRRGSPRVQRRQSLHPGLVRPRGRLRPRSHLRTVR